MGVMVIDVARYRWFILLGFISFLVLLCAILLGFLGPDTRVAVIDYAYDCPNDSHVFTSACSGVQLGQPNTNYWFTLPPLEKLNGYWSLSVFPYNLQVGVSSYTETLYVQVDLYAKDSTADSWTKLIDKQVKKEILLCNANNEVCWGFVLIYEDSIKYTYYAVNITFPDDVDNQEAKAIIGDVAFDYQWYNTAYIEEELSLRVIYLVFATVAIFVYWLRMRTVPFNQWTFEQQTLALILLSLIFLNNPFYPFEFLLPGPFFPVLDCMFQVIHQTVLLLYWLFLFDFLRKQMVIKFIKTDWIKVGAVALYGCVCFTFFTWFRVTDYVDPVFGETEHVSMLIVLFFFAALLFGGLIVAILVLIMLGIPVIMKGKTLVPRMAMATIPALVVIVSIVGALFFGVFGPVQRTAPSFVYFYTLYNLYAYVLMVGYWPVILGSGSRDSSERSPIFGSAAPNPDDIYGTDEVL